MPRDVVVVLLDSLNRHMLGCYGGTEFDTPNLDRLAARSVRFTNHHHRFAAVHARPSRPARRRARLPVAAVGLDRDLGRRGHAPAAPRRGHLDDARHRPSAPVRGGRRELPPRLRGLGLPARSRRRSVAHPARPVVDRRTRAARAGRAVRPRLRHEPHVVSRRSRLPGPEDDDRRGPLARRGADAPSAAPTSARCWSSTSSTRTSRSTHPEPWASRYDPDWDGPRLIWPPYARNQDESGLTERAEPAPARAVRIEALDDRPLARPHPRRDRSPRRVGHHRLHSLHRPRPLSRRARACGASRKCPCTPSWGTSRC